MTERLRFLLVLAGLALAGFAGMTALRGRGGDEAAGTKESAEAAFARDYPMQSGKFEFSVQAKLNGVPGLADPFVVSGSGAFEKGSFAVTARPSIPAASEAGFPGFEDEVGAALVKNVLYVTHKGTSYRVGRAASGGGSEREPQVDTRDLARNATVVGTEELDGVETQHVSADVDIAKFMELVSEQSRLDGAGGIAAIEQLAVTEFVDRAKLDLWVDEKADQLRQVSLDLGFRVPDRLRAQAAGMEGAELEVEASFSDIGKPQQIRAPRDARALGGAASPFLQGLEAGFKRATAEQERSQPAKATGKADPRDYDTQTRAYLACVANAAKPDALQKCIAGLR